MSLQLIDPLYGAAAFFLQFFYCIPLFYRYLVFYLALFFCLVVVVKGLKK